jgi:hypothetical protein
MAKLKQTQARRLKQSTKPKNATSSLHVACPDHYH